jgi:hypothetical protein
MPCHTQPNKQEIEQQPWCHECQFGIWKALEAMIFYKHRHFATHSPPSSRVRSIQSLKIQITWKGRESQRGWKEENASVILLILCVNFKLKYKLKIWQESPPT